VEWRTSVVNRQTNWSKLNKTRFTHLWQQANEHWNLLGRESTISMGSSTSSIYVVHGKSFDVWRSYFLHKIKVFIFASSAHLSYFNYEICSNLLIYSSA
jgi:hypothetical protein